MIWNLDSYGQRIALVEGDAEVSYAKLCDLAHAAASTFAQAQAPDKEANDPRKSACPSPSGADATKARIGGDVGSASAPCRPIVFLLCSNTCGCIASYLGCLEAGAVPLLLDRHLDRTLLAQLAKTYGPSWFACPQDDAADLAHTVGNLELHGSVEAYALLRASSYDPYPVHSSLGILVSTSGSTGTPKLIRLSLGNIRANTASIIEYLGITSSDRAITSLPMNYVYGLSVVHTHLAAGASLVLTDLNCYAGGFWRLFAQRECTSFAGVPFMYEMLDKLKFTKQLRYPTLTTMTQAGGHLSPDLQERFALFACDNGIRFFVMYGASEATARMSYLPPEQAIEKRGSIGIAIPGGRFELVGGQTQGQVAESPATPAPPQAQPDAVGELVYYGQNVSMGYATCPADLALGDSNCGRLVTGDMARRDEDGYYYIMGRKKRFIKILGKRTSLDEVEDLLKAHFPQLELACGGRDDLLAVFVAETIPKPEQASGDDEPPEHAGAQSQNATPGADERGGPTIAAYVHDVVGINAKMVKVVPVADIPKSSSGKVLFAKLNELIEESR